MSLERLSNHLNIYDIQKVDDQIRQALQEENRLLIEDVEYLQKCLDDEWMYKNKAISAAKSPNEPPPLQDLKEFGSKLEVNLPFVIILIHTRKNSFRKCQFQNPQKL